MCTARTVLTEILESMDVAMSLEQGLCLVRGYGEQPKSIPVGSEKQRYI